MHRAVIAQGRRALAAADEVLVLEQGHVVESGTLEGLLATGGRLSYVLAADRSEGREPKHPPVTTVVAPLAWNRA